MCWFMIRLIDLPNGTVQGGYWFLILLDIYNNFPSVSLPMEMLLHLVLQTLGILALIIFFFFKFICFFI